MTGRGGRSRGRPPTNEPPGGGEGRRGRAVASCAMESGRSGDRSRAPRSVYRDAEGGGELERDDGSDSGYDGDAGSGYRKGNPVGRAGRAPEHGGRSIGLLRGRGTGESGEDAITFSDSKEEEEVCEDGWQQGKGSGRAGLGYYCEGLDTEEKEEGSWHGIGSATGRIDRLHAGDACESSGQPNIYTAARRPATLGTGSSGTCRGTRTASSGSGGIKEVMVFQNSGEEQRMPGSHQDLKGRIHSDGIYRVMAVYEYRSSEENSGGEERESENDVELIGGTGGHFRRRGAGGSTGKSGEDAITCGSYSEDDEGCAKRGQQKELILGRRLFWGEDSQSVGSRDSEEYDDINAVVEHRSSEEVEPPQRRQGRGAVQYAKNSRNLVCSGPKQRSVSRFSRFAKRALLKAHTCGVERNKVKDKSMVRLCGALAVDYHMGNLDKSSAVLENELEGTTLEAVVSEITGNNEFSLDTCVGSSITLKVLNISAGSVITLNEINKFAESVRHASDTGALGEVTLILGDLLSYDLLYKKPISRVYDG